MATLLTPLGNIMFPHELDTLSFERDDAAETYFRLRIDVDGETMFEAKQHFAPTDALHTLTGMATFLMDLMPTDGTPCTLQLWVMLSDGTWETLTTTLLHCRHRCALTAEEMAASHFLTPCRGRKTTHALATEHLSAWNAEAATQATVLGVWIDAAGDYHQHTGRLNVVPGTYDECHIDVSPSVVDAALCPDTDGWQMARYIVKLGNRTMEYHVRPTAELPAESIEFRNGFGCWDTFHLWGTVEREVKVEREAAIINGLRQNYRVKATPEFKGHTGLMSDEELPLFTDLTTATECRRDGKRITITESEEKVSSSPHAAAEATLTWRESEEGVYLQPGALT